MTRKSFTTSDCAVSNVVGAVLMLGLIVALITTIQVSYIPVWKADAEHCHMDDVWEDMSNLKLNIDILSSGLLIDSNLTVMVCVPIKMGGGEIPMVSSGKSSGMLSLNTNDCGMLITADNTSEQVYNSGSNLTDLGTISYSSNNNYYIDQVFEYENGAMLVVQNDRSLIKLSPAITINKFDSTNISIDVNAVEIVGKKRTIGSNVIEEIYLKSNTSSVLFSDDTLLSDVTLTVSTNYPNAWAQYFNMTAKRADLVYGNEYSTTVTGENVSFVLTGGLGEDIRLHIQKITIDACVDAI